ncbi:MAG TPA: NUDIX domain-containing protein [Pseudolabrys sp.]|jgi:8-oxo-dGTP diphosphatase|nr:NUDIX domain-containing protein [Pseudolabrys sp.]
MAILAAGGIVMRGGARPLFAIVRRSKDGRWVLPRGKLRRNERPVVGAKREAVEETGHRMQVHEFIGAVTYSTRGKPKVVQYWRMQAEDTPHHEPARDIEKVNWLSLSSAVGKLSNPLESLFLRNVGRRALKAHNGSGTRKRRADAKRKLRARKKKKKRGGNLLKRIFSRPASRRAH